MNEFGALNRLLIVLAFITALVFIGANELSSYYADEQDARGVAIADFLESQHGVTVDPRDARFFDVTITTMDVMFSADNMEFWAVKECLDRVSLNEAP